MKNEEGGGRAMREEAGGMDGGSGGSVAHYTDVYAPAFSENIENEMKNKR